MDEHILLQNLGLNYIKTNILYNLSSNISIA
jgi:hypothetical protein